MIKTLHKKECRTEGINKFEKWNRKKWIKENEYQDSGLKSNYTNNYIIYKCI